MKYQVRIPVHGEYCVTVEAGCPEDAAFERLAETRKANSFSFLGLSQADFEEVVVEVVVP